MVCTPYRDKDQDTWGGNTDPRYNCAQNKKGGGWFSSCGEVHLTGLLTSSSQRLPDDKQLHWHRGGTRGNTHNSWKEAEMKLVEEPWDGTPGKEQCTNFVDFEIMMFITTPPPPCFGRRTISFLVKFESSVLCILVP